MQRLCVVSNPARSNVQVIWSGPALRDVNDHVKFIKLRNPAAAPKVRARIRGSVEHLEVFPRAGRIGRLPGTREVVLTEYPYIIRYRIATDQIQILRVFHQSTSWYDH